MGHHGHWATIKATQLLSHFSSARAQHWALFFKLRVAGS